MLEILRVFAGAFLPILSAMAAGRLIAPRIPLAGSVRFATGAAACSLGVFAMLSLHAGNSALFVIAAAILCASAFQRAQVTCPLPRMSWLYRALFCGWGLMYLLVALAPEIQEDAAGYHLRIVSDLSGLHSFSNRVSFYDALPHGAEMLFVPAFGFGGAPAAKLVHYAFLIALVPLVREIARELKLRESAGVAAAALLFLAPVCGVSGTSAYTDLFLVCACAAALYLLIRWRNERLNGLLICAGVNAGFCYAVKPSFGWIAVVGFVAVAIESRRLIPSAAFASAAAASVVPWLLRDWRLTGNPFAPFLNRWIPNAASTPAIEHHLFEMYSAFRPSFSWGHALLSYTVTGGNQGLLGPAFLLLPLLAAAIWRKRSRWLLLLSLVLAIPFLAGTGTRFLLPAMIPAALALTSVLPAPALAALVAIQAVGSAPAVLDRYERGGEWRIRDVPWRAALRIEPEAEYLRRTLAGYAEGETLMRATPAGAKIFVGGTLPESYVQRELLFYWQSALADRFTRALHFGAISHTAPAQVVSIRWERERYRFLRVTAGSGIHLQEGTLNRWTALDEGATTLIPPNRARTGADLLIWPVTPHVSRLEALSPSGKWLPLEAAILKGKSDIDVRRDVTQYMRRYGVRYLLLPIAGEGFAEIGIDMARHPREWGVEEIARSGNYWLFCVTPDLL